MQQPAAALPQALSYDDIRQARIVLGEQTLQGMESELVSRYQAQLDRLEQTSPLYWYRYGEGLRNSLQMLYPDSLAVKALDKQWQTALAGQQGDLNRVPTYLEARAGVDALIDQLLELERQRKTVTIFLPQVSALRGTEEPDAGDPVQLAPERTGGAKSVAGAYYGCRAERDRE